MTGNPNENIKMVAAGYDAVADAYFDYYHTETHGTVIERVESFRDDLATGGKVLELGCGNGLPITKMLAEKFDVTGIDVSPRQVELARANTPEAEFAVADMTSIDYPTGTFDGVIALYSIIHVPRESHAALFESIFRWLKPGGVFLSTAGTSDSENWIEEDWFGSPMYWSHYAPEVTTKIVSDVGFDIELNEIVQTTEIDGETERSLWISARKPGV